MRYSLVWIAALLLPFAALAGEIESGDAALQAGKTREALTHYLAAYRAADTASDEAGRTAAIDKLARVFGQLKPPPAVPDEAIAHEGRAEAAVRAAQSQADYSEAAREYRLALRSAPWLAADWFNLGVVLEKAGDGRGAVAAYGNYLRLAPEATDAVPVKKRIGGIEYDLERAQQAAERARSQQEARRNVLGLLHALFIGNGRTYVGMICSGIPMSQLEIGMKVGCTEAEVRGAYWTLHTTPEEVRYRFELNAADNTFLLRNLAGGEPVLVGTPQGGSVQEVEWIYRSASGTQRVWVHFTADGSGFSYSLDRPLDESRFDPNIRYQYYHLKAR